MPTGGSVVRIDAVSPPTDSNSEDLASSLATVIRALGGLVVNAVLEGGLIKMAMKIGNRVWAFGRISVSLTNRTLVFC